MRSHIYRLLFMITITILLCTFVYGQAVPSFMNYQGKLTDTSGQPASDGDYQVQFKLYDLPSGGTAFWTSSIQTAAVRSGLFTTTIEGTAPALSPLVVAGRTDIWLEVLAAPLGQQLQAFSPRVKLASTPFALRAGDLALPFDASVATSTNAFSITVTGSGTAGRFSITNAASTSNALTALHSGPGYALYAQNTGTGSAGYFSAAGSSTALYATAGGSGPAAVFNGKVGIGVSSPASKLEVAGDIKVSGTGNAVVFPDGTRQTTAATSGSTVPSGMLIMGTEPAPPTGYSFLAPLYVPDRFAELAGTDYRTFLALVAYDGKLYAFGGQDAANIPINLTKMYDPATNTWSSKTNMLTARTAPCAAIANGKIYVIGGKTSNGNATGKCEEYNPATNTWLTKSLMLTSRYGAIAAQINGKIYVIGGRAASLSNRCEEYNPATNVWLVKANVPTMFENAVGAVMDNKVYVIGGSPNTLKIQVYDPATNTWSTKADMVTGANQAGGVGAYGKIYTFAGIGNKNEIYDPATDTWKAMEDSIGVSMAGLAVDQIEGKMYITCYDLIFSYTPASKYYIFKKD